MSDSAPFFRPKLLECLRGYSTRQFFADLTAGLTVGIVALPLAMAFAIASGVKPEAGIFTAVIVYGILAKYGASNLAICTIMAGFMLLVMGAAKMGTMIKFIPYPVTMGFTSGIAVLIFCTQIKDFLGLQVDKVPAEFVEKMRVLGEHVPTLQWPTAALALASLLIVVLWPNAWARRVPSSIVALVLGTGAVILFRIPVETIGTRFGGIPQGLPHMRLPEFSWPNIQNLFQPALTIALLGAIESLLSAVVADGMIDDKHDSNQELMAQGIANIKNGGHSPVAGIVHSLTLLIILLVAAPLAKFIPLATLSAVLVVVA
jgi:sulfate permease, SulP family